MAGVAEGARDRTARRRGGRPEHTAASVRPGPERCSPAPAPRRRLRRVAALGAALAIAASGVATEMDAHAAQLGATRLIVPAAGGFYDSVPANHARVAAPARLAVRPSTLGFRFLGPGVTTSMTRLSWRGWGAATATASGWARFCPDLGVCRTFTGVVLRLSEPRRLYCRRREGAWIVHYGRVTAKLAPSAPSRPMRVVHPAALSC